jgi:outer membrane protein assembly factor BamE (lipoprotein component of BamABCDE complex)
MKPAHFLALGVSIVALAACEPQFDTRGNLPDPEVVLQVQPGIDNRERVTDLLGSPSTVSTFDDKTWYYISKKTKRVAFFDPEVLDQEVLIIKFDDAGTVSDMKLLGIEDAHQVVPNPNITPTSGKELTILQQLMGNIGRFGGLGQGAGGGVFGPGPH